MGGSEKSGEINATKKIQSQKKNLAPPALPTGLVSAGSCVGFAWDSAVRVEEHPKKASSLLWAFGLLYGNSHPRAAATISGKTTMSLLQSIARTLRIGKARYIVGHDLTGNAYLELPSLSGSWIRAIPAARSSGRRKRRWATTTSARSPYSGSCGCAIPPRSAHHRGARTRPTAHPHHPGQRRPSRTPRPTTQARRTAGATRAARIRKTARPDPPTLQLLGHAHRYRRRCRDGRASS